MEVEEQWTGRDNTMYSCEECAAIKMKAKPSWRREEISSRWRWNAFDKMSTSQWCRVLLEERRADYQAVCRKKTVENQNQTRA